MGKRELVIILGFVAAGLIAYQLTAEPSAEPGRGFSIGRLLDVWRREARANLERRTAVHDGVIGANGRTELRLSNIREVEVVGESRNDISYRLTVEAAGPDAAAAEAHARDTRLIEDDLGETLVLRVQGPTGVQSTSSLTVRVPRELAVRLEAARRSTITDVAMVYLESTTGEAAIRRVAGTVSGTHRNGPLVVEDAAALNLTLVNSESALTRIGREAAINVRNGATRLSAAAGPLAIEQNGGTLQVVEAAASVRVSGRDGTVTIERPRGDVRIDVLAAAVTLALETPVDATIFTTHDPIRLEMRAALPVTIDAATSDGGAIDARAFGLAAESRDGETRLRHTFGEAARVSIRNRRGDIVIAQAK